MNNQKVCHESNMETINTLEESLLTREYPHTNLKESFTLLLI